MTDICFYCPQVISHPSQHQGGPHPFSRPDTEEVLIHAGQLQGLLDVLYTIDAMLDVCLPKKNGKRRTSAGRYQKVSSDVVAMCQENLKY